DILDGKKPAEKKILLRNAFLTTDPVASELYPDAAMQKIEVGKNAFPDMAPGLFLPVSPDWVEITPAEAAGSK
ncbi:MAG: sugar ABC transporter substrate-binding protein, partial [Mesorhizobium sp.]